MKKFWPLTFVLLLAACSSREPAVSETVIPTLKWGDRDDDRMDDPAQCPRVGVLDCTNPTYAVCAPCIH